MRRTRFLAPIVVLSLAAASCGGSDDGPNRQAFIDALMEDPAEGSLASDLDDETRECVTSALVDAIGLDRLEGAEVTPEDFVAADSFADLGIEEDDELRADLAAELEPCDLGAPLADVMVADFPVAPSDEDRACVAASLNESEVFRLGLADMFIAESDAVLQEAFVPTLAACPALMGNLFADLMEDAGIPLDDAGRQCLTDELAARGDAAVEQILAGGAPAEQLGAEILPICLPDLAG